jgi:osmoprotectant transport system substrate-binding protein
MRLQHRGRIGLSATLALTTLVALAGCGSSSTKSSSTTAGTSGATTTTAASSSTTASSSSTTASSSGGSSSGGSSSGSVTIGSANFPENEILANVYADALEGHGIKVTLKLDIGSREIYYKLLQKGTLTVFPEYNGALLGYLDPNSTAFTTASVDAGLKQKLASNLTILNPSSAQDNDSVTVTDAFAKEHHLTSIGQLKSLAPSMTIGAASEFQTREEGLLGLEKEYGLHFKAFKPLDESGPLTIAALKDGTIQAGDIYTTDPSITADHFKALLDPKHVFSVQNVIPIINSKLASNSTIVSTLNAVSAALTTEDLVQMVGGVVNDHVNASVVAKDFVTQAKLG